MKFNSKVEQYRVKKFGPFSSNAGDMFGVFYIPGPFGNTLKVLASCGDDVVRWEHVSVSLKNRCPNWPEMCLIKDLFWDAEETVMQLHPPKSQWISNMQYCLHLWKPIDGEIIMPPSIAVGMKQWGELKRD